MKNIYDILRQAVMVLSVLSLAVGGGVLAQNNNWQQQQQQQQRQQEENRRQQAAQQEQARQQQQAQQAQAEANRRAEEQRQRDAQQAQANRRAEEQRQRDAQAEASRRAMADEQRKREIQAETNRRALTDRQQKEALAAQTKNEQEKQRQQLQNAQKAQLAGKPAPAGTPQAVANRTADRMVFSNGVAKLTRPLTTAEMKRGFTGKVTDDGRALVKFQNRVFAVPAARIGITPRNTSTSQAALATSWSPQKQSAINADIQKLAAGASPAPRAAAKGDPVKVASMETQSRIDAARAARSGAGESPAKKDLTSIAEGGSVAAGGIEKAGRAGKQARLRELANDDKLGSADRGWINQEMNSIERGQRSTIRNPPGKDLAHERGREAAKGYDYSHSNLQDRDLHRLQHKYDDFGRTNTERPLP